MARCSEDWNGRTLTQDSSGQWTATRLWCSIDALNETQALSATPEPGNDPIPSLGASHPQNNVLMVKTRTPATDGGPLIWKVVVNYTIPSLTGGGGGGDPDPLTFAKRISLTLGDLALPTDIDIAGHKMVNSAGDAFDPPPQRTIKVIYLSVRRWEPYFDIAKALQYTNKVNADNVTFGNVAIPQGAALCTGIQLAQEAPVNAVAVEVSYDFQIIPNIYSDPSLVDPYRLYLKDQGRRGWWDDSGTKKLGDFHYATGEPVTDDIPLDGTGLPLNTTIKVTKQLKTVVAPPANTGPGLSAVSLNTTVRFFPFQMFVAIPFTGLI